MRSNWGHTTPEAGTLRWGKVVKAAGIKPQ